MFKAVRTAANYSNIEGVVIGSCSIGNNINDFLSTTKNSRIAWIFGYTCEIGWMASTLVDLSLFEHLMKLKKSDLADREKVSNTFVRALSRLMVITCFARVKKVMPAFRLRMQLLSSYNPANRDAKRRTRAGTCWKNWAGLKNNHGMSG